MPPIQEQQQTFIDAVAVIDARIAELETSHAATLGALTSTSAPVSPMLTGNVGRAYESEMYWLRDRRNALSIAFAQLFL